jgi:hypothetical protein
MADIKVDQVLKKLSVSEKVDLLSGQFRAFPIELPYFWEQEHAS